MSIQTGLRSLTRSLSPWKPGGGVLPVVRKDDSAGPTVLRDSSYGPTQSELSNVDLAEEAINRIVAQRGFEANLHAIKTADDMLGRILDIKN